MKRLHRYNATITWTGNSGNGTADFSSYKRDHQIAAAGKARIEGSSDPAFRGDPSRYNPEELLVSSLSACHLLWYLHLCAVNGVVVTEYTDTASGEMKENADGSGQFTHVTLRPKVTVTEVSMKERALALHHDANKMCFIARSVNFPVHHEPEIIVSEKQ